LRESKSERDRQRERESKREERERDSTAKGPMPDMRSHTTSPGRNEETNRECWKILESHSQRIFSKAILKSYSQQSLAKDIVILKGHSRQIHSVARKQKKHKCWPPFSIVCRQRRFQHSYSKELRSHSAVRASNSHQENNRFRVPIHFATDRFDFEKFPPPSPLLHPTYSVLLTSHSQKLF